MLGRMLACAIAAVMLGFFGYGMFRFPDNPIRPCQEHGYCGKQGQPRTLEDFVAFSRWNDLFSYWPVGIISLIALQGSFRTKKGGGATQE